MARKKRRNARRTRPLIRTNIISGAVGLLIRYIPFILIVAVIIIGSNSAISFFLGSDYFKVKVIRASGDLTDNEAYPIGITLASKKGFNIFKIDLKGCEAFINKKYPELKDVRVSRILPDALEVSCRIRKPFLQVESGYYYLVSDDGMVLPNPQTAAYPGLPMVTGIKISEIQVAPDRYPYSKSLKKAISLFKEIGDSNFSGKHKVIKINVYDPQNPAIYLEDKTRIEIGEYKFREKEGLLEEVLNELESKNRKASVIDLRFEDVVIVPR